MNWKRKRKVRMHLVDRPGIDLPRVDGILVSKPRALDREYVIAVPSLQLSAEGNPVTPEGRFVVVPESGLAFYEIL